MTANISLNSIYANQFREAYHSQFYIPAYLSGNLEIYKRLNWSAEYFIENWNKGIGTSHAACILRYGHMFHINFCKDCSLSRIKLALETNPNTQLILSFRKTPKLPALVLVDFLRGE